MAYDTYGRPQDSQEPDYFHEPDDTTTEYMRHYSTADNHPSRFDSSSRQKASPPINPMGSTAERPEPSIPEGVSPELIAAITEKVKKEGTYFKLQLQPRNMN